MNEQEQAELRFGRSLFWPALNQAQRSSDKKPI